jgi:hypothetical protein
MVKQRGTGVGNMGSVTSEASVARFGLDDPFVLVWLKARATGGTGSAALTMKLDHTDRSEVYDWTEAEAWAGFGSDGDITDIDWRVPPEEYPRYSYGGGERLVFEWTNPDAGNMRWAIEVGLARASV